MKLSVLMLTLLILFILGKIFLNGLPQISWTFLTSAPSHLKNTIGILPEILNTVYLVFMTLLFVIPLGVGAAVYLTEYATKSFFVRLIEYASETLSGIPSIIYGLAGLLLFTRWMGTCLLAGVLTLAMMNLPSMIRTVQECLKAVPQSYREGAYGMGAGRWQMIRTILLPACSDGIVAGSILTIGKILGESAALLYTAGLGQIVNGLPEALFSPGSSLTVALYVYSRERGDFKTAFAIATVLLVISLLLNWMATHFQKVVKKKQGLG